MNLTDTEVAALVISVKTALCQLAVYSTGGRRRWVVACEGRRSAASR